MKARIYQQSKVATQSGHAKEGKWVLEYGQTAPHKQDFLMGWTGSKDPLSQVKVIFATQEEAEQFAQKNGIAYRVEQPSKKIYVPKSYADNFRPSRVQNWTH
ncbi:ETC complex I subunit [Entomobacter blattae]|uniref:Oxidoreductase n=1 Tax=Entomobacter blattae TaxID=2762277 RepID=A0A7H1NQD5_9PROT|nr:ETC complex I subunit [Entomobacter blattae]QNT77995.1 hypothetical protein JGUZn3_07610 [Entomobacter blattae]